MTRSSVRPSVQKPGSDTSHISTGLPPSALQCNSLLLTSDPGAAGLCSDHKSGDFPVFDIGTASAPPPTPVNLPVGSKKSPPEASLSKH